MTRLVEEVVEAHGGRERWAGTGGVVVIFSAGGLQVTMRGRRSSLRCQPAVLSVGTGRVELDPFPRKGLKGVVEGGGAARVVGADAEEPARRDLDLLRFAAATVWAHTALPFALLDADVREVGPGRLQADFPDTSPSPWRSRSLIVHVDPGGRIVRYDDTLPMRSGHAGSAMRSGHAGAAHVLSGHCDFGGLVMPTRARTFSLRRDGSVRRRPLLGWTDVVAAHLVPA